MACTFYTAHVLSGAALNVDVGGKVFNDELWTLKGRCIVLSLIKMSW